MKAIADLLQKVLPEPASPRIEAVAKKNKKQPLTRPSRHFEVEKQTEPIAIPSTSAVYETPKPSFTIGEISDDNDDDVIDDDFVKGDTRVFGWENVVPIASPYILPYLSKRRRRHLDTRYGIRKDSDKFKIGDSTVLVDTDSDIKIRGKEFRGTTGL